MAQSSSASTLPKPFLDSREALDRFFQTPKRFYFAHEFVDLADILRDMGMHEWSRVPRLYFIFRELGKLHLLSSFLASGISEEKLPLEESVLQSASSASTPAFIKEFMRLQNHVLQHEHAVYQAHLDEYLDPKRDLDRHPLDDMDFEEIGRLLEFCGHSSAGEAPKLYYVLWVIGEVDCLSQFQEMGYNDMFFPFPRHNLGVVLKVKDKRDAFIQAQRSVYSRRWSEEVHLNFPSTEHEFLKTQKELGVGGTGGEVEHVYCKQFNRHYARKTVPRTKIGLRFFANEVRMLKSVSHRHCVSLVGSYTDPEHLAILSQPVAEMNLETFLESVPIPFDRKLLLQSFFGCLSVALHYLHSRGIRHKDIKPQNILIHNNTVLFTDFGLSSDVESGNSTLLVNTPQYTSPEFQDGEPRDMASDIWSLGCVFFEMLAGLLGLTIADVRKYFSEKGTGKPRFHANTEAIKQWLTEECKTELLERYSSMAVTAKLVTADLLRNEQKERPDSEALVRRFGSGLDSTSAQYGSCCKEELERTAQESNGGSTEAGSRGSMNATSSTESGKVVEEGTKQDGPGSRSKTNDSRSSNNTSPEGLQGEPSISKTQKNTTPVINQEASADGGALNSTEQGHTESVRKGSAVDTAVDGRTEIQRLQYNSSDTAVEPQNSGQQRQFTAQSKLTHESQEVKGGRSDKEGSQPQDWHKNESIPKDERLVEQEFKSLMSRRGWDKLPEQARRQMAAYSTAKKWTLVKQDARTAQQPARTRTPKTPPEELHPSKDEGSPGWYVGKLMDNSITMKQIQGMQVSLRTQRISWVAAFIEAQGQIALARALLELRRRDGQEATEKERSIVKCLKALINTKFGANGALNYPQVTVALVGLLTLPRLLDTQKIACEILTFICHWGDGQGHSKVIEAFDQIRYRQGENGRFDAWLRVVENAVDSGGTAQGSDDGLGKVAVENLLMEYAFSTIILVNIVVDAPEQDLQLRCHIRAQLTGSGIERIMTKMERFEYDIIEKQIQRFRETQAADNKDFLDLEFSSLE